MNKLFQNFDLFFQPCIFTSGFLKEGNYLLFYGNEAHLFFVKGNHFSWSVVLDA